MLLTIHVRLRSRKQDPQGEPPSIQTHAAWSRYRFGWNAAKPGQGGYPDISGTHAIKSREYPHPQGAVCSVPPVRSATCRPGHPAGLLTLIPELVLRIPHHPPRGSVETWRQPHALLSLTAIHHLGTLPGLLTLPLNHTHAHTHAHTHTQATAHPVNCSRLLEDQSNLGPSRPVGRRRRGWRKPSVGWHGAPSWPARTGGCPLPGEEHQCVLLLAVLALA